MKKVALFLIGFIGCSCALFSGLYKIDVYRMENNLPVVFSVWRTDYTPQTGNQTEQPENGLVSFEPVIETESIRGLNANITNNSGFVIMFPEYYRIEKNINGRWVHCQCIDDSPEWSDISYYVEPDAVATMSFYWAELYGELSSGEYRIVKEYYFTNDNSKTVNYMYCYFSI